MCKAKKFIKIFSKHLAFIMFTGMIFYMLAMILPTVIYDYMDQDLLRPPEPLVTEITYIVFAGLWISVIVISIRQSTYRFHTGRDYERDVGQYRRSYTELKDFFSDADPYRIDPETLPSENWQDAEGIILGHVGARLIKRPSSGVGNLAVYGLPGSGKTMSQLVPTAIRFQGSCLCIDIKGDIISKTKSLRNIRVFDPTKRNSLHFNPLYGIDKESIEDRILHIEQIGHILIQPDPDDPYWSDTAFLYFCGIALYLLDKDINTTFPEIISKILHGNAVRWVVTIREDGCSEAREYTDGLYGNNEKNISGAYQNLCKSVKPLYIGKLKKLLDGNGDCITAMDLEDGSDVYIEIPQSKKSIFSGITTIIVQQFLNEFMNREDVSANSNIRPILFLLDEFPTLKFDFDTIQEAMSTLRSKKVSLFLGMQSVAQLEGRYGRDGFRQLMDNIQYVSVMSATDPVSRKYFADLVGTKKVLRVTTTITKKAVTRTVSEGREYIFQPEDFGNLDGDVVIVANGKYIRAQKTWFEDKNNKRKKPSKKKDTPADSHEDFPEDNDWDPAEDEFNDTDIEYDESEAFTRNVMLSEIDEEETISY